MKRSPVKIWSKVAVSDSDRFAPKKSFLHPPEFLAPHNPNSAMEHLQEHLPSELAELTSLYLVCWERISLCKLRAGFCDHYFVRSFNELNPDVTLDSYEHGWPCTCEEIMEAIEEEVDAEVSQHEQMEEEELAWYASQAPEPFQLASRPRESGGSIEDRQDLLSRE